MLGFSQPERGRLCVIPSSWVLLTKPTLPVLLGHISLNLLEHHGALAAAKPPEEPGPWLPRPRMETVLTHFSEGGENPAAFLPSSRISWIIFLSALFSL